MKIRRITLSNYMPFGSEVELDLSEDPDNLLLLINGMNGVGKSALMESVYWAIKGATVRDIPAADVMHHGAKQTTVTLESDIVTIRREYGRSKKVVYTQPGADPTTCTLKEGDAHLNPLLDPEGLFGLTAFFGRKFPTFSRMKPAERATIIAQLSHADIWDRASRRANSKAREAGSDAKHKQQQVRELRDGIVETTNEISHRENSLRELRAEKVTDAVDDKLEKVRKLLAKADKELDTLYATLEERKGELRSVETQVSTNRIEQTALSRDLARTDQELQRFITLWEGGVCPTCSRAFSSDDTHNATTERRRLTQEVNEVKEQQELADQKAASIESARSAALAEVRDAEQAIDNLQKRWDGHKATEEDLVAQHTAASLDQRQRLGQLEGELKALDKELTDQNKNLKKLEEAVADALDYKEGYQFWIEGCKTIRQQSMEQVAAGLSKVLTQYLTRLGLRADRARVSLWKDGGSGTRPEVNIYIERGEYSDVVEALSEGETQRVDLACFFGLRAYVRSLLGFDPGFMVLDEPLSHLDDNGKYEVFQLIEATPGQRFVMDHDANFKDLFDYQVDVGLSSDEVAYITQGAQG